MGMIGQFLKAFGTHRCYCELHRSGNVFFVLTGVIANLMSCNLSASFALTTMLRSQVIDRCNKNVTIGVRQEHRQFAPMTQTGLLPVKNLS